ncbi:MAG: hypothetical protein L0226_15195 [Acidobacteria bacterium]|nr:hypothetical protein [Acidobacteriota bacterium]
MKRYTILTLTILLALVCAHQTPSNSQTRPKRRATPTPAPVIDMRPEATRVADQIKNFSRFLYIYGKVQNSIEFAEEEAKRAQANPKVAAPNPALNKKNKDDIVASINGLRTGLATLVNSWQGNPRLQIQYLKISYAAEATASAEQLATAGRYRDAGNALITAVERLTDTLISMRLQ